MIQEVSFLQGCDIERDLRGHSQVPCYIVSKKDSKYFMKLYPGDRVDELRYIESVYKLLRVPTAYIIEIDYLQSSNQTYCIYEFIEGATFGELLPELSLDKIEQIGYEIGQELAKFSDIQGDAQKFQRAFDREVKTLLQTAREQKQNYNRTHDNLLPEVDLDRLESSLQRLKQSIYALPPTFIHSDINLNNIIIHQEIPYLIDTEGSQNKFRALNFRGNCWWCWNGQNTEREQAAYRGIYRGLFCDQIPDSFHEELAFTIMYQFLHRVQKYAGDDEQVHYSFLRWHDNLEQTNYFENYRFDWF